MQGQISSLTEAFEKLTQDKNNNFGTFNNSDDRPPRSRTRSDQNNQDNTDRLCRKCRAPNYYARACNWNEQGNAYVYPEMQCRVCGQNGHSAIQCVKHANSGNHRNPGATWHAPLGGK